ncbi:MAG: LON peptidase substrate-binding domain-containing protein, partial [Acidimicrobiales bacterium]
MPKTNTITLPLLPLRGAVVLPGMVLTMTLESPDALSAFDAARRADGRALLLPRLDDRYAKVGTVAAVEELSSLANGARVVAVRAQSRAAVGRGVTGPAGPGQPGSAAAATWVEADELTGDGGGHGSPDPGVEQLAREYRAVVESILEARGAHPLTQALRAITDPGALADSAGYLPELTLDQRVELLETVDVGPRLAAALGWARDILADIGLKERIRSDVTEGMEKTQREFLLRQQLEAIKRQLNEGSTDVVSTYRERVAKAEMPEGVLTEV